METKALIGLVLGGLREGAPHSSHTRHATNIKKWTNEALVDIGLTAEDLVLVDARV